MAIVITSQGGSNIVLTVGSIVSKAAQITTIDAGYTTVQDELTAHEEAIGTAQGDATTAIENAATAQGDATTAIKNAATAQGDVDALKSSTGITFSGEISLGKTLSQYSTYSVASNINVTLNATKIVGGSAEIRMIGDGSHVPVFSSNFTKHPSSGSYVNTLNTINYVVFYFNGTESLYSINQL